MGPFNLRRIELKHLWVITVLIGVFVFVNTHPIRPNDFWWHMAVGRQILSSGEIPAVDQYSYTMPNEPYPSYQMFWLPEIGLFSIYQPGGPEMVVFITSLIITIAYAILIWLCFKVSSSWRIASAVTILAIGMGINNWNVRPQVLSYLLGVLFLFGIYSYRRRPHLGWLAIFPLGMLVWVNSHGSFPIGFVLLGIWFADEVWQWSISWIRKEPDRSTNPLIAPGIALILTALASLANPRGAGIIDYIATLSTNSVVQNLVIEWAPPTLNTQVGAIFIFGFLITTLVLIFSPKRPDFFQLVTYLVFGILAFKTVRGGIWYGLVMAPVVADHLVAIADTINFPKKDSIRKSGFQGINLAILLLLISVAVISVPWLKPLLPLPVAKSSILSDDTPLEATNYLLEKQPEGRLFHDMGFGSYLIWAAQPDYQVFVDPRIELYTREIWEDYIIINNVLPGWEDYLERYDVGVLMLSPKSQADLIQAVEEEESWERIYQDDAAVIFKR